MDAHPHTEGLLTGGLTAAHGALASAQHAATCSGMAHFAGTGPAGRTCRECAKWGTAVRFYRRTGGELRRRRCARFSELAQGRIGAPVGHHRAACRHFALNPDAPPVTRPARQREESKA